MEMITANAADLMKQIDETLAGADIMPNCFGEPKGTKRCGACGFEDECIDKRAEVLAAANADLVEVIEVEFETVPPEPPVLVEVKEVDDEPITIFDLNTEEIVAKFVKRRRNFIAAVVARIKDEKPATREEAEAIYIAESTEAPTDGAVKYDIDKLIKLIPEVTAKRKALTWA